MRHKKDIDHLKEAIVKQAVLFTFDRDFERIHKRIKKHFGIIILYQENNPKKDMKELKIAKALKNVEGLNLSLKNNLYKLNDFNF